MDKQGFSRARCSALLVAALLSGLSGCASVPSPPANGVDVALTGGMTDPAEIVDTASQRQARGDYQGALVLYLEAAKVSPDSDVWLNIGIVQSKLGLNGKALAAYERAVEIDPTNAKAYEGAGLIYLDAEAQDTAQQMLRRAVDIDGSLWRAHNGLGVIADLEGRYEDAIEQYEMGLAVRPDSAMLRSNIGYSRYLSGDLGGAESDFIEAISLDRRYTTAWKNLGLVYARTGRYRDALELLQATSDKSTAYNDVGYIAMLNEDFELAETFFDEAIRLSPRYYASAVRNREMARNRLKDKPSTAEPAGIEEPHESVPNADAEERAAGGDSLADSADPS